MPEMKDKSHIGRAILKTNFVFAELMKQKR